MTTTTSTKTLALAACLGVTTITAGCSEEADIGVDIDPVSCSVQGPAGEVHGSITDGGYHHDFGATTVQLYTDPNTGAPMVTLADNELILQLDFQCGPAGRATSYGVIGNARQQQLACPDELYGGLTGQIEILAADSGVVIVDEGAPNSNCFAGRFHVDFGGPGDVTGWFLTPPAP